MIKAYLQQQGVRQTMNSGSRERPSPRNQKNLGQETHPDETEGRTAETGGKRKRQGGHKTKSEQGRVTC